MTRLWLRITALTQANRFALPAGGLFPHGGELGLLVDPRPGWAAGLAVLP